MMDGAQRICANQEAVMRRCSLLLACIASMPDALAARFRAADAARLGAPFDVRPRRSIIRAGAASMSAARSATAAPSMDFAGATRAAGRAHAAQHRRSRTRSVRPNWHGARQGRSRRRQLRRLRRLQHPVGGRRSSASRSTTTAANLFVDAPVIADRRASSPPTALPYLLTSTHRQRLDAHHRLSARCAARAGWIVGNFLPYAMHRRRGRTRRHHALRDRLRAAELRRRAMPPARDRARRSSSLEQRDRRTAQFIYGWSRRRRRRRPADAERVRARRIRVRAVLADLGHQGRHQHRARRRSASSSEPSDAMFECGALTLAPLPMFAHSPLDSRLTARGSPSLSPAAGHPSPPRGAYLEG